MADAIKQKFNITADLIKSSGGVFEIHKDGQLIFSKRQTGRFPETDEILEKLL